MKQDHGLAAGQGVWTFCCRQSGISEGFLCRGCDMHWREMRRPDMRGDSGRELVKGLGSKIIENGRM